MIKIMFVCHGNICRSPMAEFVMKKAVADAGYSDRVFIASCATSREEIGNDIYRGAREKLTDKEIPFCKRQAVQLTKSDYKEFDLIVAMEQYNIRNIMKITGDTEKVRLLLSFAGENRDIDDPWYSGNFERAYNDIDKGCSVLMAKIKAGTI